MVDRIQVFTYLNAENDRSEVALVAGRTNNSFKAVQTPENAVLYVLIIHRNLRLYRLNW